MSVNHDTWKPGWVRGSKLKEMVWITNNVLAWCSGMYIMFFDIKEKKFSCRWCWNSDSGEGAQCLSTHVKFPVFAFAEKIIQPRIIVVSYPSMMKVCECQGGSPSGYLATAFTVQEYLVSVGFYPHFPMIVWNWRNGEKIISVNTHIRDEVGQILRITQLGPIVIAQMGRTCGKLFTWELDIAEKVAILRDYEVKLPQKQDIRWIDWCPTSSKPLLAIADHYGHVHLCNHDGTNVNRIVLSQRCIVCPDYEMPIACWFRDGIVLRTTFCQLRYYSKNVRNDTWRREWYVKGLATPYMLAIHPSDNSRFFYYTTEGYLMQVEYTGENQPNITTFMVYGAEYKFVDFVYPWCHHLVATDSLKELLILECYSGRLLAKSDLDLDGEIACQVSHPDYPLTVLGTTDGKVIFVNLSHALKPTVVASLRLQREPLDLVKFSYSGRFLIAAEKSSGNCYCINLHRTKVYTVQALIQVQRPIIDLLFYESSKRLRLLVLFVSVTQYNIGQQLELFEILENQNLVTTSVQILDLPGAYRTIAYMLGDSASFLGSPYMTRQIRLQKVKDFKEVVMTDGAATGHQVKMANLFANRFWITTTALDGLVFVRDKNIRQSSACVMSHHRADLGNVKAMVNKSGDLIVCLGYDGSLVALRSTAGDSKKIEATSHNPPYTYKVDPNLYEKQKKKIRSDYLSLDPTVFELLTRPKVVVPDPELGDKTWAEWREEMQILEEEKKSREEKAEILQDFKVLKGKVKKLLDENEVCPEIEKLPVFQFDLDKTGRDQTLKAGRDECEDLRLRLEHDINEMRRVSEWIHKTYWDTQKVFGTSLVAIFDKGHVTNYALSVDEPYRQDHFDWACFCKEILNTIVESETFRPWKFYTKEELEIELHNKIKLKCEEEERIDLMFEEEEEDEKVEEEKTKKDVTLEGTTTHRYVESSPYYSQLEYYGFHQMMVNNRLLRHDCVKLRTYFNQAFDKMYREKEREMNIIRDRIDRIQYIDSELRTMFGRRVSRVPNSPEWYWQEKPDGIIKVLDHEVKAKPYISPSMQEILDKQAAEAERIRQLLLADDFRERALMAMMDGVLEVRWEDIIKIDIPKPAFMLEKKPDDYTAEEILLVKQYEKDVQYLQEERQRYHRMLDAECIKVAGLLNEGIERFNERLNELFRLKIKIEAAINQLNLRYVRSRIQVYDRSKALQKEAKSKAQIAEMREYKERLKSDLQIFQNVHQQTISKQDTLINRQKTMEKKFKSDFSSLSKLNQDLLERQYKRRPKTNLKNLRSSEFEDLSEHALKKTRAIHLPSECNDYLRALDYLDIRPATLPPSIDTVHWDHLIRMRRQKIGVEIKMRAKYVEILHTESIILELERRIEKCRLDIEGMNKDFVEYRAIRNINELNVEIQLVMKMGQLEIEILGDVTDTKNAILVCQSEIEAVNELIRAAGACKLKVLSRLLNFQKGTLTKQWQHECDRKRLQDLQEDFRFVESMMVTKEMQSYLKRKARGMKDDKTQQQLAQYINMMTQRFKKTLEEHQDRFHSIQSEILDIREKNTQLDQQILKMNVARCEMELSRDLIGEARQQEHADKKLKMIMKRATLIKKLQDNYADLLELQTEHELLRIRRYPTFNFKILDGEEEPKDDLPSRYDVCP